jgi:uncharacterized protein YkwD
MKLFRLTWLIGLVLTCAAPAGPTTTPTSRPTTRPAAAGAARDWFAMSLAEFEKTDAANTELPQTGPIDDNLLSAAVLHYTNQYRVQNKLPALKHMEKVQQAAIMHATDMSEGDWYGHENDHDPKKHTVVDRVKLLGLNPMFAAENILIAYGVQYDQSRKAFFVGEGDNRDISYESNGDPIPPHTYRSFAKVIVDRWYNSPHHRENMLSPHAKFMGAAARAGKTDENRTWHKFYGVQVFFAPMPGRGRS